MTALSTLAQSQKSSVSLVMSDLLYKNIGVQGTYRLCPYFMLNGYIQYRPKANRDFFYLIGNQTTIESGYVLEINPALRLPLKSKKNEWGALYAGPYAQVKKFRGEESGVVLGGLSGPYRSSSDRHFTVFGLSGGLNVTLDKNFIIGCQAGFGKMQKDLLNGDATKEEIRSAGGKQPPLSLLLARLNVGIRF